MGDWLRHGLESMGVWSVFVSAFLGPYLFPAAGELAIVTAIGLGVSTPAVLALGIAGGMASDQLAFGVGRLGGRRVARRLVTPDKRREYEDRLERHAVTALVWGRMLTGVRTWLAIVAGVGRTSWARFVALNFLGCVVWAGVFTAIGVAFGATADVEGIVEGVLKWTAPIVVVLVLLLFARGLWKRRGAALAEHDLEAGPGRRPGIDPGAAP